MDRLEHSLWVEKYRPNKLENYIYGLKNTLTDEMKSNLQAEDIESIEKTQNSFRLGSEVESIILEGRESDIERVKLAKNDLMSAARCGKLRFQYGDELKAIIQN